MNNLHLFSQQGSILISPALFLGREDLCQCEGHCGVRESTQMTPRN